jgi:hypothetical protein
VYYLKLSKRMKHSGKIRHSFCVIRPTFNTTFKDYPLAILSSNIANSLTNGVAKCESPDGNRLAGEDYELLCERLGIFLKKIKESSTPSERHTEVCTPKYFVTFVLTELIVGVST